MSAFSRGPEHEKTINDRRKAVDAERKAENARLENAVDAVLKTEPGRAFFKHLFKISGYNQPSLVFDAQTARIDDRKTLYNEARRMLYIKIRALVHPEILVPLEVEAEAELKTVHAKWTEKTEEEPNDGPNPGSKTP